VPGQPRTCGVTASNSKKGKCSLSIQTTLMSKDSLTNYEWKALCTTMGRRSAGWQRSIGAVYVMHPRRKHKTFGQLIPLVNLLPRKPPNMSLQADRSPRAVLTESEKIRLGCGG
jgi:hypothetical protein